MLNSDSPREINRAYQIFHSDAAPGAPVESPLKRLARKAGLDGVLRPFVRVARRAYERRDDVLRLASLPALVATPAAMIAGLKLVLRFKPPVSGLHRAALDHVGSFVRQYPLHLYPVVCKSLELAYLQEELASPLARQARFVEVAIGEGSFSKRIFPATAKVVGLDISPFSLVRSRSMEHVERAVICDCLNPPVRPGAFDVLLANNFLHHVSAKDEVLGRWAKAAPNAVFNENTPYWASGWAVPYVLRKLGLKRMAARRAAGIERHTAQDLHDKARLDATVAKHYEVTRASSFMSERTFFLCAVYSFLMRCEGPPTPERLKSLFLGPLRALALPLTQTVAELLIRFDAHEDRASDTFVSYSGRSRSFAAVRADGDFVCPSCQQALSDTNRCGGCGARYREKDGMLFLLDRDLRHIEEKYDPVNAGLSEHL